MEWNGSILIASIVALIGIGVTIRNHSKDIKNKEKELRRDKITKQLTEFYSPILTYLQASKAFSRELLNKKPNDFNLLAYLLDENHKFEGDTTVVLNDKEKELIKEVMKISDKISTIIVDKGGLVEDTRLTINYEPDPEITNVILDEDNKDIGLNGLLLVHYKILESAQKQEISGNYEYYKQFVFPREFVKVIKENYHQLKTELENIKLD